MDADTSAKFINSVVKSIQSVCHGYVEFKDHIKVIGHLYLSVDSALNHNYIVNEQVCKNDRESSTMFLSNSYHSEPPAKKTTERDKRRAVSSKSKQDIRDSETRLAAPSDMGHVESDVMLFAAENFPPQSTSESFQYTSQPHRPQPANKRKRTLSGGADLGASGQSVEADVAAQIVGLIDQDLAGSAERNAAKARRLSEGDSRVPDNGQDVLSFSLSGGGDSSAGDWDVNASLQAGAGLSTSNKDGSVQESASASGTSRAGPTATVSRAPSADQSKDSNPPSRASSTPSVKEEPQVDVDLTIVKEEEAPTSQSSCMQSGKGGSSQPLPGASNANYSSGQWDIPGHLQQQQDLQSRVMRLDPNSSSVEYSSPPTGSTSQAQDPSGLNMLDNAQLYPVMLHPNTAASQDILSAVSMVEGRSMGQTLPSVMSFSNAGAMPSTSGHRMDMGPKPGGPRPGRLPRNVADQYGAGLPAPTAMAPGGSRGWPRPLEGFGPVARGGPGVAGGHPPWLPPRSPRFPRSGPGAGHPGRRVCNVCGKSFHKDYLKGHMALHTGLEKFKCSNCGRRFKWASSLASHRCFFKMAGVSAGPGGRGTQQGPPLPPGLPPPPPRMQQQQQQQGTEGGGEMPPLPLPLAPLSQQPLPPLSQHLPMGSQAPSALGSQALPPLSGPPS